MNKNYGFVLCVWDHIFGTFEPVKPPEEHAKYQLLQQAGRADQCSDPLLRHAAKKVH